jgi:glycine/D-amino acid oxidase-like deaminating enzyme
VTSPTRTADAVIVGAGMVGAATAYSLTRAGLRVAVIDRAGIAGGTTSAGEGNVLVSDKAPGPELDLALQSSARWRSLAGDLGAESLEYEPKGGVVVARTADGVAALAALADGQRAAGVTVDMVDPAGLAELEPNLTRDVAGGAWYPQDAQAQPMLAAATLLRAARAGGATVHLGTTVRGIARDVAGEVTGVRTDDPELPSIAAPWVVNAAGSWAGQVAELAGAPIPVLPRRGVILVTEPLPRVVRHKVYTADYVANVASSDAGLETSVVVEGTRGGTVLIGASRERVGFDRTFSLPVVRRLAAQAVGLFPFLADVSLLRSYLGFRPYCPDHLPIIGEDPRAPGLVHACGHEGAGIGLAPGTASLIADILTDRTPSMDLAPFRPDRFPAPSANLFPAPRAADGAA